MAPGGRGRAHGLPLERSSFIGRRSELRQLRAMLASARLVTLTGVGGVGKTRLALRCAADLEAKLGGRAWFADLAPLEDPVHVAQAVARAIGVRELPGTPLLNSIATYLRSDPALLVLDNCEHVLDGASALVVELLQECPDVQILATSREALRCEGETLMVVPPLGLPTADAAAATILRSDAVQLFIERAATTARFEIDAASAPVLAALCVRLDGLPLAVELAAGMLRAVGPAELLSRLDQSLRLLRAGARGGPARHASLEATIDWSYRLLSPAEQRLFNRLSVFAGGATLEAAERVCTDDPADVVDVLPTLAALVDKSLVVAEHTSQGATRYRQLETLREYARARLAETADDAATRQRHAAYFLRLAQSSTPGPRTAFRFSDLRRLDPEHENLRAALEFLGRSTDARLVSLAAALCFFWFVRGHYGEGVAWTRSALEAHPNAPPGDRSGALCALAAMLWPGGDAVQAAAHFEESLRLARDANEPWRAAQATEGLAITSMLRGESAAAIVIAEEAVRLARGTGDQWLIANTVFILANALELSGEPDAAESLYEEVQRIGREGDDEWILAHAIGNLAAVLANRGELERSARMAREALGHAWRLGDLRVCANLLVHMAVVAMRMRRMHRAARLLGAAEAIGERLGTTPERPPADLRELVTACATGPLALSRERGRALKVEAAIEEASLVSAEPVHAAHRSSEPTGTERSVSQGLAIEQPARQGRLTRRELEIARLVAQGLTNQQIAQLLVITEGTTQNHLSHILDKLGATSRTQVAAWVLGQREAS